MDLLFREYTSPFILLDNLIISLKFNEWIDRFLESHKEKIQWELWLHKVLDKTWNDYKQDCDSEEDARRNLQLQLNMSEFELETTVKASFEIINGFNPERG